MQNSSTTRRPFGIGVIVLLLLMQVIFEIAVGTLTFVGTTLSLLARVIAGWAPLIIAILLLVLAWALLALKPWAYWALLIVEIVNIALHFLGYQQTSSLFAIMSGGILSIVVVIYLLVDGNVRRAFRTGS